MILCANYLMVLRAIRIQNHDVTGLASFTKSTIVTQIDRDNTIRARILDIFDRQVQHAILPPRAGVVDEP